MGQRDQKNLLYDGRTGWDTDRQIIGQTTYHSLIRHTLFLGKD